jgi:hypothetical protein
LLNPLLKEEYFLLELIVGERSIFFDELVHACLSFDLELLELGLSYF